MISRICRWRYCASLGEWPSRATGLLAIIALVLTCSAALLAAGPPVQPFEAANWSTPANVVDAQVEAFLAKQGVALRNPCSDSVFIRRVYLDVIGTLPAAKDVDAFLNDQSSDKRAKLIEDLLARDEFADYWAMKWADILRVKSEFPVNLWPNAVQAYYRWIHDAIRDNKPYDQFARELLTSSGSNFRVPQVNFYRAVQGRDSASIAKVVALTFMGVRFDKLPKAAQGQMAAFFSKVAYKKTSEWKEEIIHMDPAATKAVDTAFPDGTTAKIPNGADPRLAFANWLTAPSNKWFARNIVNRVWAWTMGRGIIHEPDDIRTDNPPASPEVLACLEKELVKSKYDLKQVYRLVLNSRTYQQSSIPHGDTANPKVAFAHYTVRQLDAEVLIDAMCWIGGDGEKYSSPIPEPFTFIPTEQRTIALADGSITSAFLTTFGRPSRDTGVESERSNQPTDTQRLYMLNSSDVQRRIQKSPRLQAVINSTSGGATAPASKRGQARPRGGNRAATIRRIYLMILSRYPTQAELSVAQKYFAMKGLLPKDATADLAWALINSKEFLFRH